MTDCMNADRKDSAYATSSLPLPTCQELWHGHPSCCTSVRHPLESTQQCCASWKVCALPNTCSWRVQRQHQDNDGDRRFSSYSHSSGQRGRHGSSRRSSCHHTGQIGATAALQCSYSISVSSEEREKPDRRLANSAPRGLVCPVDSLPFGRLRRKGRDPD